MYIYISIYLYFYKVCSHLRKARVQNGVSGSLLGAVFEVVAGTKSEVWTNLSGSFIKGDLLQLPGL